MKIAGIIAEYNPFHRGHAYHIETTRTRTDADFVIVAMSGNFVQRGAPAAADKYTRTNMALLGGADLVLELPVCAAVSSAETFARSGIALFQALHGVTHISFGCESADDPALLQLSDLFAREPEGYRLLLSSYLKEGLSFPAARAKAAAQVLTDAHATEILKSPNNILAIEYLKAIRQSDSDLIPCMISRSGKGYHDMATSKEHSRDFCSATALRNLLLSSKPDAIKQELASQIPAESLAPFQDWLRTYGIITEEDLSFLLHYKLMLQEGTYPDFGSCSKEFARRIANKTEQFTSFGQFCASLKSKDMTYTAISRYLIQFLLDIRPSDLEILTQCSYAPYGRILGFRRSAAPLLTQLKKSQIPLIFHLAKDAPTLSPEALHLLDIDIRSAHIYHTLMTQKSGHPAKNEFRHPLIYV